MSCVKVRAESVVGIIGTSSASDAPKMLSETSDMLGAQSRMMYAYSSASGRSRLANRRVGRFVLSSARSRWR